MDMKTIKFGLLVLATAASTLFGHQASAQFQGHIGVHPGFGGPGFGHDNGFAQIQVAQQWSEISWCIATITI